jgi:hypothetical protein
MPFIFKKDSTYVVYAEDAFDDYDSAAWDITDNIVETLTSKSELSKFDIDITIDSDGNIEQSDYEQVLKLGAEKHQNDAGMDITIVEKGE